MLIFNRWNTHPNIYPLGYIYLGVGVFHFSEGLKDVK